MYCALGVQKLGLSKGKGQPKKMSGEKLMSLSSFFSIFMMQYLQLTLPVILDKYDGQLLNFGLTY